MYCDKGSSAHNYNHQFISLVDSERYHCVILQTERYV